MKVVNDDYGSALDKAKPLAGDVVLNTVPLD
jgi:hypothetical protein